MGFDSLQHMQGTKVHLTRACLTRYVPPPGFDYPLGGLRPSNPGRPCFMPAALVGFPLRSVPLLKGTRRFPREWTHLPFSAVVILPHFGGGPAHGLAVSGL
jgi:hypothetical protein